MKRRNRQGYWELSFCGLSQHTLHFRHNERYLISDASWWLSCIKLNTAQTWMQSTSLLSFLLLSAVRSKRKGFLQWAHKLFIPFLEVLAVWVKGWQDFICWSVIVWKRQAGLVNMSAMQIILLNSQKREAQSRVYRQGNWEQVRIKTRVQ